jgi:hypothetical protein
MKLGTLVGTLSPTLILALGIWGCGESNGGGSGGTGLGGSPGTGGDTSGKGGAGAGGMNGSGGAATSGGVNGSGGVDGAGGVTGRGGSISGSGGKAGGGADGTGGVAGGPGGNTSGGGSTGPGGSEAAGGRSAGGRAGSSTVSGGVAAGGKAGGGVQGNGGVAGGGGGGKTGGNTGSPGTGGTTGGGGSTGGGGGTGSNDATYVPDPGWACGMPDGIPAPSKGTLAFSISIQIGATHDVGDTPYGHRRLLDVKGGTISGDKLKGSVVTGGLEYELTLSNGVIEYHDINILKASDGSYVYLRTCGVAPSASAEPRVVMLFDAVTSGSASFLNDGKFVATRVLNATGGTGTLQLDVYDVSKVTAGEPRVTITKPSGVTKQPWDCNTTTGTQGATVFTENVSLGSSFSFTGKKGSHNVIPITGGTTTGKVEGAILNGGADYQLSGSLDAWYTLAPSNGEFILVRNCGGGKLIPWFEAKVDGKYNFLNTQAYLSSSPGVGSGGVSITFYERK